MIKIEHTVFSAPFMLSALIFASDPKWPSLKVLFWACVALIGARSAAMSLNRLIDWRIDALNPRTAQRAIPAGKLSPKAVFVFSVLGFSLMALAALNLPKICFYLLPVAVLWLSLYSYFKRFSWLAHYVLGIALGGAVLGGWLAVTGSFAIFPVLFALGVSLWVAGFDILYAIQDLSFDQSKGLHSIPAKFGLKPALWISRFTHLITLQLFFAAGFYLPANVSSVVNFGYWSGVFVLGVGVVTQQWLVHKDLKNIEIAFFTANAWVSTMFLICILMAKMFQFFL